MINDDWFLDYPSDDMRYMKWYMKCCVIWPRHPTVVNMSYCMPTAFSHVSFQESIQSGARTYTWSQTGIGPVRWEDFVLKKLTAVDSMCSVHGESEAANITQRRKGIWHLVILDQRYYMFMSTPPTYWMRPPWRPLPIFIRWAPTLTGVPNLNFLSNPGYSVMFDEWRPSGFDTATSGWT